MSQSRNAFTLGRSRARGGQTLVVIALALLGGPFNLDLMLHVGPSAKWRYAMEVGS
jgi:hypothetical protein